MADLTRLQQRGIHLQNGLAHCHRCIHCAQRTVRFARQEHHQLTGLQIDILLTRYLIKKRQVMRS